MAFIGSLTTLNVFLQHFAILFNLASGLLTTKYCGDSSQIKCLDSVFRSLPWSWSCHISVLTFAALALSQLFCPSRCLNKMILTTFLVQPVLPYSCEQMWNQCFVTQYEHVMLFQLTAGCVHSHCQRMDSMLSCSVASETCPTIHNVSPKISVLRVWRFLGQNF